MRLDEKYRPKNWEQVIGQDKAVKLFKMFEERGKLTGRGFFVTGKSGQGKTTLVEIAASKIADPVNIIRWMASEVTVATLKELRRVMAYIPMGVLPGKAIVINEAHGLRKDVIRGFKDVLETLPEHVSVFFTTTKKEGERNLFDDGNTEDANPFRDRCTCVNITDQGLAPVFAERAKEIAEEEGLDGKPIESYLKLAKNSKNSMRRMLSLIESGEMM
jgi:DNA polymerase III delta prime subunit